MEKEKDRVEIKLNSPNNSYFSGQQIDGQICFFLTKKTKIRAINLQVLGKGKCKWIEIYHKDIHGNVNSRQLFYTGKKIFLNETVDVPYVPARGIELAPGELSMDFTYQLTQDLPSSFKGSYGSIKYKLKVVIQKPWTFDEKYTIPLTIVRNVTVSTIDMLDNQIQHYRQDLCKAMTRNVSVFGSGPISLIAKIPRQYVVRNEKLNLHVTVDNCSSVHVDKLRFTIIQKVSYRSIKPMYHIKTEEATIFTKETGGVEKKTERSFAHDLLIPACPPTHDANIITFEYVLNVEAILPAFYKNLLVSFNLTIYSRKRNSASGNPFEETDEPLGVGIFPVTNHLSSFISTNSPTHSQLLNESESSSLYSTTSESSTTTLSPATRPLTDCETLSSQESIRRNMHRRSLGYLHSTTTSRQSVDLPSMAYPMLAEDVSEVYDIPAMNSSYPPPNTPALPIYLQSSANFQVQARYPVNELPPSYDELFPRARSKSPTAPSPETLR